MSRDRKPPIETEAGKRRRVDREDRLAAQLRQNLARRKEQGRCRDNLSAENRPPRSKAVDPGRPDPE